jgi:hypothetical protein
MNQKEFAIIAGIIKTAYPNHNILPTRESIATWYELLNDLNYEPCRISVIEYIKSNKYPPTIADIRDVCTKGNGLTMTTDGTFKF